MYEVQGGDGLERDWELSERCFFGNKCEALDCAQTTSGSKLVHSTSNQGDKRNVEIQPSPWRPSHAQDRQQRRTQRPSEFSPHSLSVATQTQSTPHSTKNCMFLATHTHQHPNSRSAGSLCQVVCPAPQPGIKHQFLKQTQVCF